LNEGEADYYALFPRGWVTYNVFDTEVGSHFYSPIIKDNYRETSLPVAIFMMKVLNPLQIPVKVSTMFTFPNAPYTGPTGLLPWPSPGLSGAHPPSTQEGRTGLKNEVPSDAEGKVTAIVMKAGHPSNPSGTQGSAWCIATLGKASYVSAWDGEGDGADIRNAFAAHGTLSNSALSANTQLPSAALAVETEITPHGEVSIPFVLAWFFPEVQCGEKTRWRRCYTEYYLAKEGQALAIAKEALLHHEKWLEGIEAWTGPIINNPACPDWLKQGGLNELYYSTFGSF
jgi:non-lysosomal glucosylceramidase